METALRLPQIRGTLIEELNPLLAPNGFKVKNRRGENSFFKKYKGGYFAIQFFYNEYFPIDYEVYCAVECYQDNVQKVIKDFFGKIKKVFVDVPNIYFREGDFVEDLRGKLAKYRSGYKNKLSTPEDLEKVVSQYKELINTKLKPMEDQLYSMRGTAEYLYKNRDLVVSDYSENMMMTSLIALKAIDDRDYENLYEYYIEELSKRQSYGLIVERAADIVKGMYQYLNDIPREQWIWTT